MAFNLDLFSTAVPSGGLPRDVVGQYSKRARGAMVANGYSGDPSETAQYAPSSGTGETFSTNYPATHMYNVAPYVLVYENDSKPVEEPKNWTSKLSPSTFVMTKGVEGVKKSSGKAGTSHMLTVPQLNYQLHCMMASKVRALAGQALGDEEYTKKMYAAFHEVFSWAQSWSPSGVEQTHPNYPLQTARQGMSTPLVVQCKGVAFCTNMWGENVGVGSTLWLRLCGVWVDQRESKTYKVGDGDFGVVSGVGGKRRYCLPRFEAVVNNKGYSFSDPDVLGYKMYRTVKEVGVLGGNFVRESAVLMPVGVVFDVSGLPKRRNSVRFANIGPMEVSHQENPDMTNQIQVLLTHV